MIVERPWGYYKILSEVNKHVKLKELVVNPHSCLSMQRHSERSEIWFVAQGHATLYELDDRSTDVELVGKYNPYQTLFIPCNKWHQLCNEEDEPLHIIEIQHGERCVEEDIERKNNV